MPAKDRRASRAVQVLDNDVVLMSRTQQAGGIALEHQHWAHTLGLQVIYHAVHAQASASQRGFAGQDLEQNGNVV